MLGPKLGRAALNPSSCLGLCILSTPDCAEEVSWYKHLQKASRVDYGTGIGFGKLGLSLALLLSVYVTWRWFHSSVLVRMRIFPFFVLQDYEDQLKMFVRCLEFIKIIRHACH